MLTQLALIFSYVPIRYSPSASESTSRFWGTVLYYFITIPVIYRGAPPWTNYSVRPSIVKCSCSHAMFMFCPVFGSFAYPEGQEETLNVMNGIYLLIKTYPCRSLPMRAVGIENPSSPKTHHSSLSAPLNFINNLLTYTPVLSNGE
jgi:hypothetical protein